METASWKKNAGETRTGLAMARSTITEFAGESGHFLADLGFEHLFTGHAGLLTPDSAHMWPSRSILTRLGS